MTGWTRFALGIVVVLLVVVVAASWLLPGGPVSALDGHEVPRLAQTTAEPTKPTARPRPVTVVVVTKPVPVTVIVVTKIVVTEGIMTPTPTPTAAPMLPDQPPVVPEASTTVLVLAGAGSLAGYVVLQWRARRR